MEWSETAWDAAAPVFRKIVSHPFILELASGELPREKFMYYIAQDGIYLKEYVRVMSYLASRFQDPETTGLFLGYATENLDSEQSLHARYDPDGKYSTCRPSPACMLSSSRLWRQVVAEPLEIALASVLPCFSVYAMTGKFIYGHADLEENPYKDWISVYGGEGFDLPVRRLEALCNSFAAGTSSLVRDRMTKAFVDGVRLEWMFWDSAYNMETWKI